MIEVLDYEPVTGRMLIRRDGALVTYLSVPIGTFIGLRFAPNPDAYFTLRVAGAFRGF